MKFDITLGETDRQIEALILSAIKDEIFRVIKKAVPNIKKRVGLLIISTLKSQPEYESLKSGTLQAEFGLANPQKVENILEIWANSVNVFILFSKVVGSKITGGFELRAIKSDYSDVLSSLDAYQKTENNQTLEWLRWLLLEGDRKIVKRYEVQYTNRDSRTGKAVMVKSRKSWGVPAEFAGTVTNNWVTRGIDSIESDIAKIIDEELNNVL